MRKIVTGVTIFIVVTVFIAKSAYADFGTAYQDYVFSQQQYKNAHNNYRIAKSTYQTYGTLTSQNEAVSKLKTVLKARNQVMQAYYNLLQEKLNSQEGVSPDTKNTFSGVRTSELTWLSENQTKIEAAESLEDLNDISEDFNQKYPQMNEETKQAVGSALIAKEEVLRGKLNVELANFSQKIAEIRQQGENTTTADRGLITIQDKLNFQSQKTATAKKIFTGGDDNFSNEGINLLSGQKSLIEANQYLKEATNYLLELVRSFTG